MEQYDVVIIGAGLAGLQCARLLGASGFRVLLADRKTRVDERIHTTGIFVRRTLEGFDIPSDCLGPPIRTVSLYSPSLKRIDLVSRQDEFRVGRMGALYSHFLADSIETGVAWLPGFRFAGLQTHERGVRVKLESSGGDTTIESRFIIGADGASSRIAESLGLSQNREWIVGIEDIYTGLPLDGTPRFDCYLDPRLSPGYLAWVVNDGDHAHIGVGGYANRFRPAEALEEFKSRISGITDTDGANWEERRGGRIPVGGVLPHIANRCGLLVGDAAGAVSPLTAGGLDPCLRLSSYAARVAESYLSSGDAPLCQYDLRQPIVS